VIQIRNLMFQPLTFHLIGDDSSIHLKARECRIVSECQLSDEIRAAASRGFVSITPIHETTQPDPEVDTAELEHNVVSTGDDRAAARPKKGKHV
jgi:hypothetical protein